MRHIAARLVGRHLIQERTPCPQHSCAHRAHYFVARKRQEVAVEFLHIERHVWRRLCRINQNFCSGVVDDSADLGCGINDSQYIRNMGEANQPRAGR